jgi:hypothetical protein
MFGAEEVLVVSNHEFLSFGNFAEWHKTHSFFMWRKRLKPMNRNILEMDISW